MGTNRTLGDRTIAVVLEFLEQTLEEFPLPRFIHVSDGVLAAPVAPMLAWSITKGAKEPGALCSGAPVSPLGLVGVMGTEDGPVLVDLDELEAAVVSPLIRKMQTWTNGPSDAAPGDTVVPEKKLQRVQHVRQSGTAQAELRGCPVPGSLEIQDYTGMTPVSYGATMRVESAGGSCTVMRDHGDRAELERECQEIFDAGDVVVSGPLVFLKDGPLIVATTWEPVKDG